MPNFIHVLCRSPEPVTYAELGDFMANMGFLDEDATFEPPLDGPAAKRHEWGMMSMRYRPDKRPIQVQHWITQEEIQPTVAEIMERMEDNDLSDDHQDIVERLKEAKQGFEFELDAELPDDVWEMLDATEAWLCRERDGIILAHEGVFDAKLNQIFAWDD